MMRVIRMIIHFVDLVAGGVLLVVRKARQKAARQGKSLARTGGEQLRYGARVWENGAVAGIPQKLQGWVDARRRHRLCLALAHARGSARPVPVRVAGEAEGS